MSYGDFMRRQLRALAFQLGVSYEDLIADPAEAAAASPRFGELMLDGFASMAASLKRFEDAAIETGRLLAALGVSVDAALGDPQGAFAVALAASTDRRVARRQARRTGGRFTVDRVRGRRRYRPVPGLSFHGKHSKPT